MYAFHKTRIYRSKNQVILDPLVLVDALAIIMGHEERELCKPGHLGLVLIVDTASTLLGSREMVNAIVLCPVKHF